ncbi:hypothetical protein MG293_002213 [Ovis ammon polii]|uniref:Uncharacterized protein n=1 Tax=Ovis ammon polii TaxID=230172 RepID=A0AAD4YIR6_OVIAM|nr:hypothetical protein MG293_002213 [Ovis ammon polii]
MGLGLALGREGDAPKLECDSGFTDLVDSLVGGVEGPQAGAAAASLSTSVLTELQCPDSASACGCGLGLAISGINHVSGFSIVDQFYLFWSLSRITREFLLNMGLICSVPGEGRWFLGEVERRSPRNAMDTYFLSDFEMEAELINGKAGY